MSNVILKKWGNSIGIRIPAIIMKEAHLTPGEELEIKSNEKGELILTPIKNQQEAWMEMFNVIADSKEEALLLDISNEFDVEEWTW